MAVEQKKKKKPMILPVAPFSPGPKYNTREEHYHNGKTFGNGRKGATNIVCSDDIPAKPGNNKRPKSGFLIDKTEAERKYCYPGPGTYYPEHCAILAANHRQKAPGGTNIVCSDDIPAKPGNNKRHKSGFLIDKTEGGTNKVCSDDIPAKPGNNKRQKSSFLIDKTQAERKSCYPGPGAYTPVHYLQIGQYRPGFTMGS